mgnify:CR=1 FL=1|jgi:hypothetical protein
MIDIKNKTMKKLIIWLAKIFNVNLTVEKVIYKDKIVEVIKEVPKEVIVEKEVIKEVIKEVPVYKEVKYVALKDEVTNDTYVEGNLVVKGYLYVDGEVSCYKIKEEEA